jgi:prepilin-type N-terminal cleavage/methylation domain-containing protein
MRMHRRQGFTLMEVIVVSGLMAFLAMLLASASAGIGRPAADVIRRSQSLQEMNLAISSLARDLGGSLADPEGRIGGKSLGQLSECLCLSDSQYPPNSILRLSFNNGTNPETVIQYYVQPDASTSTALGQNAYWLIRADTNGNTTVTAARNLNAFQVTRLTGSTIQISLSFLYRMHQPQGQSQYLTRTCSMVAKTP